MNRGCSVIAFLRAGANDRWNLNSVLKNDRAGLQAGPGFHDPYLLSPDFTSVRRRAGRPQPELLLLVAPSLPASKAGLQIGSRFHGCVSFRYRIWRLFLCVPPSLIRALETGIINHGPPRKVQASALTAYRSWGTLMPPALTLVLVFMVRVLLSLVIVAILRSRSLIRA